MNYSLKFLMIRMRIKKQKLNRSQNSKNFKCIIKIKKIKIKCNGKKIRGKVLYYQQKKSNQMNINIILIILVKKIKKICE